MDRDEVKIQIKTALDSLGSDQAKKVMQELQAEAKGTGNEGAAGLAKFGSGVKGVTSSLKVLRSVMAGFGMLAFIKVIGDAVRKVDEFISAKKRMSEQIQAQNDANAAQHLLDIYSKIKEALQQTNEEIDRANSLEDRRLENARKLEDAQMRLAEENEVGALDAKDPDRAEKEKAIRARFAARRGEVTADRAEDDIEREASRKEESANADDSAIAELKEYIQELRQGWTSAREKGQRAQSNVTVWNRIVGRADSYQDMANAHHAKANDIADQMMAVMKDVQERERRAAQSRQDAAIIREGAQAVRVNERADGMVSARATREADEAVAKKETDRDARQQAQAEQERIRKQTAEQQERINTAKMQEAAAKSDLDFFDRDKRNVTTTNTRQRDAARAPLDKAYKDAVSERQNAERTLAQYMESNKDYLKGLTSLARDNKADIDKLKSRLNASGVDAASD